MGASSPGLFAPALGAALRRRMSTEWFATPMGAAALAAPRTSGFAGAPRDLRPHDEARGRELIDGAFVLGGEAMRIGAGGDPWSRASPSRRFAVLLHRFGWMGDLLAAGEPGAREALRLTLDWKAVFGRWNGFAWGGEVLDRRVFNLACAVKAMSVHASDFETQGLADSLARQARHLMRLGNGPLRAAERHAAAAVAGAALSGTAGERLMTAACARLGADLALAVHADGGHATRSPQAGMELLFDLLTLDDALSQRGRAPPEGLSRAIDRLTAGLRLFTLADGRLAAFQGGESADPRTVIAARAHDESPPDAAPALQEARHAGYQRLTGRAFDVFVDAGAPAAGAWSTGALGQPLAIEVICGRDRLIAGSGWSELAAGPQALRLAAGGSTVAIGAGVVGEPLRGFAARALGARLVGGIDKVVTARRESDAGVWLDLSHDGWLARYGLTHERRLFLDRAHDELRGEDRFAPGQIKGKGKAKTNTVPIAIHFHLHPDVRASLARDQRSVLLKGASNIGWWLRNDAGEVSLEPSVHFRDGRPMRTSQVVLRGRLRADRGGRVRWKLARAEET
jgi:uncharacterized heparinase superfamily protein